ncbi:hypothetical protein IMG5_030200 [Ichthyophthirius multifiliis]|uniref:fructose-bisphosphatase n=1 Tax=Ichthyophthirius multifiliis TaxID=5932 RepID=G0QLG6_ICHMU|nr:hypothetical protein IMG5_030200 [Ichthyophthirius multifiliis]EGR33939.1 hypothetical protein IMG5_030200 [Ichthyophthirius multifiliis]|eukprot:XP_004039243.1 hypothetical protein IMG5_030200 [Ichthyophthirius multifiliis]
MEQLYNIDTNIFTLTRNLVYEQQQIKEASGDFTFLISSIQTACKFISSKVKKAGIAKLYGQAGIENTSGDSVKKLDVLSNEVFINSLRSSGKCCILASEEEEKHIEIDIKQQGKYVVCFDPLDGSSNIDANVSIGSIFGIWKRVSDQSEPADIEDILQSGRQIVAAGYCLYGSSTQFVISTGNGVNGYTLDPSLGEFVLTHPNIQVRPRGNIYSINEGNSLYWDDATKNYIKSIKQPSDGNSPYSLRYIGSMVADIHRTILYGGIFLYPTDKKNKQGKLRVLYETLPMAFIIEKAGGKAITGDGNVLDIKPKKIHERCGIICGSFDDVNDCEKFYLADKRQ